MLSKECLELKKMWECVCVRVCDRSAFLALWQRFYLLKAHILFLTIVSMSQIITSQPFLSRSFSSTFSSHLPDSAPQPRLSLPSILIISFSIDLLPLHPTYLMLAWLIIVPHRAGSRGGCQPEFSRLRWIFIVFVPWCVRAHQLVLKHTHRI